MNKKQLFFNTLGWGFFLWFVGYALGMVLFPFVRADLIGWVIAPIGTVITLWVLLKKIHREKFGCYIGLGVVWLLLAMALDYFFIIKLLKPVDGYYKADVYVYYALTLILPIVVGWWKMRFQK